MKIRLQRVEFMTKELKPGILYVSEKYSTAAHLCACGCGAKIRTPLDPTEWTLKETKNGPTLWPSVGNWQQKCQSHYFIRNGEIVWTDKWSPEQILAGRREEESRRQEYFAELDRQRSPWFRRAWLRIKRLWSSR